MNSSTLSSLSVGSFSSSSIGDSADLETNLPLNDRLKVFKTSHFDPNAYVNSKCQTMHEKVPPSLSDPFLNIWIFDIQYMKLEIYG
jgi:hypothetical protein